jgi:hypothetical protein
MRNFIVILENPFIEITELIVSAYVAPGNYPLDHGAHRKEPRKAQASPGPFAVPPAAAR